MSAVVERGMTNTTAPAIDLTEHGCAVCDTDDVETYHWSTEWSAKGVAWSCKDHDDDIEALRTDKGVLTKAAVLALRCRRA